MLSATVSNAHHHDSIKFTMFSFLIEHNEKCNFCTNSNQIFICMISAIMEM